MIKPILKDSEGDSNFHGKVTESPVMVEAGYE